MATTRNALLLCTAFEPEPPLLALVQGQPAAYTKSHPPFRHGGIIGSGRLPGRTPPTQKEIGERLARQALCHTYHRAILPSGPLFRKIKTEGKQAILEFDYAEDLKTADGQALRTFETAGDNGIFYPATAIIKGNRIIVESEKVSRPHAVRYGWQPFTRGNLVNKDNLPASTFRTDL